MKNECEICKRYFFQGGSCTGGVKNCIAFEEEPRGRKKVISVAIPVAENAEITMVKPLEEAIFIVEGREVKAKIVRIKYVNMAKCEIGLEIESFEKELLTKRKKKRSFKVILGGA